MKRNKILRIIAIIITICLTSKTTMDVFAYQNRSGNFNRNYSLTGDGAHDVVSVAAAQLGKTGSNLGYSEQWCADFVSDCASLAGQSAAIPADANCTNLRKKILNAGGVVVSKASAKPGDIVFYGTNGGDHVEIVYAASNGNISTYGGNSGSEGNLYNRKVKQHATQTMTIAYIVRPNYSGANADVPSLTSPQLSLSAGTITYKQGENITFNWTWGGSEADGYDLFIAKNIAGTKDYDWNNARRIFFPGNATTSGVVATSLFASEGGYAAYIQACAPNDKRSELSNFVWFVVKNDTPKKGTAQLDVWMSRTKMGEKTDVVPIGKTCYLCYRIIDKETKENWDGLYQSNYNVKETVAKPNGEICFYYSYTNDNNWIAITPEEVGEYKGMAEVTGDFSGKLDCQFVVKKFYYGDINADDDITVTDLAMVMQAVDDTTILTTDQKKRADVNADGVVTKEDLALIQEFVLGTITEFPAESHVHSYTSSVTKKATCSSTGVRTYSCVCGASYTETIFKTGHTPVTDQAVAATCTRNGKTEGSHCSVCGEIIVEQQTIRATGHQHKQVINAREATCTEEGYTGDTYCSDCGQKISSGNVIHKKGHIWDSGVITKNATALEEGIKTYTCTICGEERTETVQTVEAPENGTIITDWQAGAQYKVTKSSVSGGAVEYKCPLNINATVINIPQTITYSGITYNVTSIADNAFKLNNNLKKVTIGNNVSAIGQNAFANCGKLVSVKMSNHLVKIGDKAFYKCKSLTKITIPYKVRKIGYKAFYRCSDLKNIDIKTRKLTANNVGKQVFKGISSRATFKVPADRVSSYKKILKAVGIGSKVRIRK